MAELPPDPSAFGLESGAVIAVPAAGQILYRITANPKPAVLDFLPNRDKHKPQMRGESWLLFNGLSMFADRGQAEAIRDRLRPGQHVVEVRLPDMRGIALARTRKTPGHHMVWGRPEDLLSLALEHQGYPVDKEFR